MNGWGLGERWGRGGWGDGEMGGWGDGEMVSHCALAGSPTVRQVAQPGGGDKGTRR